MEKSMDENASLLNVLLEEKKLVYQEKLQLIKTSKSVMTLLIPFLAFLLDVAQKANSLYIMIPFVICAVGTFLMSNEHTQNLVYEYLDRLDIIQNKQLQKPLPLFQNTVGEMMANSEGFSWKLVNPYVLFGISMGILVFPIYIYCTIQADAFLLKLHFYWWNIVYDIISYGLLLILMVYGILYGTGFKEIREIIFNKQMEKQGFSDAIKNSYNNKLK